MACFLQSSDSSASFLAFCFFVHYLFVQPVFISVLHNDLGNSQISFSVPFVISPLQIKQCPFLSKQSKWNL